MYLVEDITEECQEFCDYAIDPFRGFSSKVAALSYIVDQLDKDQLEEPTEYFNLYWCEEGSFFERNKMKLVNIIA